MGQTKPEVLRCKHCIHYSLACFLSTSGSLWKLARRSHADPPVRRSQEGYRQGITAGKEAMLQPGFDQGFASASPIAHHLGILRGIAASLLSLLTTAAAAKHAALLPSLPPADSPARTEVVARLREIVTAIGKLDEVSCLPVDEEAEAHAREHEKGAASGVGLGGGWDGTSQVKADKDEMRDLELMMGGVGKEERQAKVVPGQALEEIRARLEGLLVQCGLAGMVPPPMV